MQKSKFWELVRFTILAIIIVVPIRIFIAQPFIVSGSSMSPTFENGEYLIVDEISYRLENPVRNDVIVFRYPNEKKKFFIKRIIGLPNEEIQMIDGEIFVTNKENPEGFKLNENYLKNKSDTNLSVQLKENEYFVVGDNRTASYDSRSWGPVQEDLIIGKVFLRLLPFNRIALTPGEINEK